MDSRFKTDWLTGMNNDSCVTGNASNEFKKEAFGFTKDISSLS